MANEPGRPSLAIYGAAVEFPGRKSDRLRRGMKRGRRRLVRRRVLSLRVVLQANSLAAGLSTWAESGIRWLPNIPDMNLINANV